MTNIRVGAALLLITICMAGIVYCAFRAMEDEDDRDSR